MIKTTISILITGIMMMSCTPGLYKRLDSTAPQRGLIFPGLTRQQAERYLGPPLLSVRLAKNRYQSIYAYERERSGADILITDILDFATCNLGNEIVSPIDRFSGTTHLIAITYCGADQDTSNDQVLRIIDTFLGRQEKLPQKLLSSLASALKTAQKPVRWVESSISALHQGNSPSN